MIRWLWAASGLYALAAGTLVTIHWMRWQTGVDTGVYTQVVLNTFNGFRSAFENGPHFAVHFSPLLGIFFPLVAITHSGLALELAQVVLVACVPVALYGFILPHVGEALALRVGFITLLYPPLAAIGIGEFHILACLPLLVVGALWALDRGHGGWFGLFAGMLLLVREDVLLELLVIGVVGGIVALRASHGVGTIFASPASRSLVGAASIGLGVAAGAVAALYFGVIQPAFGHNGWYPLLYYRFVITRGSAGALAQPPVGPPPNPSASLLRQSFERFTYLLESFVPLALLPFRTWWWLLAVPGLTIVLAATSASIWTMGSQYALLWAPWLLVATAVAVIQVRATLGEAAARRWTGAAIGLCLVFLIAINPMHLQYFFRPPYHDLVSAQQALACVPQRASVATHDEWFTHIAGANPQAKGNVVTGVDYLVYADDYPDASFEREIKPKLQAEIAAGHVRVLCSFGSVRAYQRTVE
ncbi:MAG TPA: DUF2079 domain-containing protein [Candidatus Eremiobacteraceae bacterium]|nr:DUF2079 domain-containing protein [Candidatus Eremiobacteraceae bacterium]